MNIKKLLKIVKKRVPQSPNILKSWWWRFLFSPTVLGGQDRSGQTALCLPLSLPRYQLTLGILEITWWTALRYFYPADITLIQTVVRPRRHYNYCHCNNHGNNTQIFRWIIFNGKLTISHPRVWDHNNTQTDTDIIVLVGLFIFRDFVDLATSW